LENIKFVLLKPENVKILIIEKGSKNIISINLIYSFDLLLILVNVFSAPV
jgi:hypothetical protein